MIALLIMIFPACTLFFVALAWNAPLVDENEQPIEGESEPVRAPQGRTA